MLRRTVLTPVALALVLGTGCGDEDVTPFGGATSSSSSGAGAAGGSGGSGGEGGAGGAIAWSACPLITDGGGDAAECAAIPVPVEWDVPEGQSITFYVKRLRAAQQPSRGQVWLLQGGPGGSVVDFESLVEYMAGVEPTLDWYMPEHRGVGLSSRLSCPDEEDLASDGSYGITAAEMPACLSKLGAEWGAALAGFTTENAARDLGETIERTREPRLDVFVFGISYGSHWGNRYLQIYPSQATAVGLAAIAVNASFADIDVMFNGLGERYLGACGVDPFCSAKLGADPWAAMTAMMSDLDAGHCPEAQALGIDRALVRNLSAQLLYGSQDRMLIPPIVYRLARCSAADVNALGWLAAALGGPPEVPLPASERFASQLLGNHIGISELWTTPPPDPAVLAAYVATANVALGASQEFAELYDTWPRYVPDPKYHEGLADTSIPILLQHGELDFLTSAVYQPVADHLSGPSQSFVLYPRSPHSPFDTETTIGESCGLVGFYHFLLDPTAPVDVACLPEILPLEFDLSADYALAIFGTADAWEGDPGAVDAAAARDRAGAPEIRRLRARRRARPAF